MLIVGLGNPTQEYENIFHNMGFMTVDALARRLNKKLTKRECQAVTVVKEVNGEKVILAKPHTYMNLSGMAVKALMAKYGQTADDLVVIYDDVDIPRFTVRSRASGNPGTHNGMKNIVATIGTSMFKRVRIGIGKPEGDLASYVLSRIPEDDRKTFDEVFDKVGALLEDYVKDGDFEKLMRETNVI